MCIESAGILAVESDDGFAAIGKFDFVLWSETGNN
jgi:hypothetical protein